MIACERDQYELQQEQRRVDPRNSRVARWGFPLIEKKERVEAARA